MPRRTPPRRTRARTAGRAATAGARPKGQTSGLRVLQRRLARLAATLQAERGRHAREIAALRRATDRRLAAMMSDIAALRHHEARAAALARLVAERDASLAAHAERIARLEALLRSPPGLG